VEIEDFKTLLKQRLGPAQVKTSFTTWLGLLEQFNKLNPTDDCFYMLTTGKGTSDEARSRFLTHAEALVVIKQQIAKSSQ
jgi:hypothetical protein